MTTIITDAIAEEVAGDFLVVLVAVVVGLVVLAEAALAVAAPVEAGDYSIKGLSTIDHMP